MTQGKVGGRPVLGRRVVPLACLEGESGSKGGDLRNKIIAVEGGEPGIRAQPGVSAPALGVFLAKGTEGCVVMGLGAVFCGAGCAAQPCCWTCGCFHPPIPGVREFNGVLVLFHPCPRQSALGTSFLLQGAVDFGGSPRL